MTNYPDLLCRLVLLPKETEWVEFKLNNDDPQEIGDQISALSNSAALHQKERAFIVWGVADKTHELRGTTFKPHTQKVGNEELENWLTTQLRPHIQFWIRNFEHDGKPFVFFEIEPALNQPVAFKGKEHIRVGSYTKPLHAHPEKERALWRSFERRSFETDLAVTGLSSSEALTRLQYQDYFELTSQPLPVDPAAILSRLIEERLVKRENGSSYAITNMGAILFAKDLRTFDSLRRKAVRIIFYKGTNRTTTNSENEGRRGYASGFTGLVEFVRDRLPQSEEIREALRIALPRYPEIAIRELLANALIHQDFSMSGVGPLVEVFDDRVEITNPGAPLIEVDRFLDLPPHSRNEKLAHLMRRLRICEERGSGIDKVLGQIEAFQLPAPDFQVAGDATKVIIFGPKGFAKMTKEERIRACYQHAGLRQVSGSPMTNETLRKRFGFSEKKKAQVSRIIAEAVATGLIKLYDPTSTSRRHASYVPYWA